MFLKRHVPLFIVVIIGLLTLFGNFIDNDEVQKSLESLKGTAKGETNLFPHIIQAVKSHATLGEISDALRSIFGEY